MHLTVLKCLSDSALIHDRLSIGNGVYWTKQFDGCRENQVEKLCRGKSLNQAPDCLQMSVGGNGGKGGARKVMKLICGP